MIAAVGLIAVRAASAPLAELFTRATHLQLCDAMIRAAKSATKLAIDILHHQYVSVNVSLIVRIELLGRELI